MICQHSDSLFLDLTKKEGKQFISVWQGQAMATRILVCIYTLPFYTTLMTGNRALVDVDTKLKENINLGESRVRLSTTPQVPRAIAEVAQIIMFDGNKVLYCQLKEETIHNQVQIPLTLDYQLQDSKEHFQQHTRLEVFLLPPYKTPEKF